MVKAQGKIGHPANADEVVAVRRSHYFCTFFNFSDTQNRELGLVNDGRPEETAKYTGIRDRKGAALQVGEDVKRLMRHVHQK